MDVGFNSPNSPNSLNTLTVHLNTLTANILTALFVSYIKENIMAYRHFCFPKGDF